MSEIELKGTGIKIGKFTISTKILGALLLLIALPSILGLLPSLPLKVAQPTKDFYDTIEAPPVVADLNTSLIHPINLSSP